MSLPQLELHDRPRPLYPSLEDRHLSESPVFVDDAGRRRRLVRAMAVAVAAVAVLWLAAVAASLVGFQPLPIAVLDGDRREPAAAVSERSSGAVFGRESQADEERSLPPLRAAAATPSSSRAKRAPAGSRRPRTPAGGRVPRIRTERGAPTERGPDRTLSPGPDAIPAPAPSSPGVPGGVSPAANSPSSPASPATGEPAPTTPAQVTPPRTRPSAPPLQRDERAAGDPAFGAPAADHPAGAGRPGS
jgi:hypothetical protein